MHLIQKKIWCIGLAVIASFLCTACDAVPLSERRIVKALFFEQSKAEFMVTLLLQKQDEDSDTSAFGRGESFSEALYSAQNKLDGEAFYGTTETAVFPYECSWEQVKTIGELLYDKVAPIPEISVFELDKPIEQGNKGLYDKQYEKMKEAENEFKFHWGLESVFAEKNECVIPILREDGYACAVIGKQGNGDVLIQNALEAQLLAIMNGHGSKIKAEPVGINAAIEADAHIEHSRTRNTTNTTLVLDDVQWTALQDSTQDRKTHEKILIEEIKRIFTSYQSLFRVQGIDPFHENFYIIINGLDAVNKEQSNVEICVVLKSEKTENKRQ